MAQHEIWGGWAGSGRKRMRLRHVWYWSDPTPGQASIGLNCQVWLHVDYGVSDSHNSLSRSGIFGPASQSNSISLGTGGSKLLATYSKTEPLDAVAKTVSLASVLSGVEYVGASASLTSTVELPGADTDPPSSPAWVNTTRVGTAGVGFQIDWAPVSGASHYILGVRRGSTGGDAPFTTVAGTSYVDTMPPDDQFQYWVRAVNSAGEGPRTLGPIVYTRPAPPRLSWSRSGAAVVVSVVSQARYPAGHRVQWRTVGSSTWQQLGTVHGASGALTHTPPSGAVVEYRADTYVSAPSQTESVWAEMGPVQTLAPPLAPTLLAPMGVTPSGSNIRMEWRHEPVDGSAQSSAEVRYRPIGASAWVTAAVSTPSHISRQLALGHYEWQVRTRGAHASYGPWSEAQGFRVAPRPTASFASPTPGVYASNRVAPALAVSDASGAGIAGWRIELLDSAGARLAEIVGAGDYAPTVIPYTLANHTGYLLRAQVTSNTGLASLVASLSIRTSFALPGAPSIIATWREDLGQVVVSATRNPGATPTAEMRIEVQRGNDWVALAAGAAQPLVATDYTPPLAAEATYRAVAISALPSEAASTPVTIGTPTSRIWVTGADGKGSAWLDSNVRITEARPIHAVLEHYEGESTPTAHFGPERPIKVSLDGDITPYRSSPVESWWPLLHRHVWLRTPAGHRLYGVLHGDIQVGHDPRTPLIGVRLTFEVTKGGE